MFRLFELPISKTSGNLMQFKEYDTKITQNHDYDMLCAVREKGNNILVFRLSFSTR